MAKSDLIKLNQDLRNAIELARIKKQTEASLKPFFGGVSTIQGIQGIQGVQGEKGDKGGKGDKGDKGEQGKQGIQGIKGIDGKDGRDGLDGKDGKGVSGINGVDGKDGKDGMNGIDGTILTPEQVRDKLTTLEGDARLDATAIKNLPNPSYKGGGGGGIQRILAGTNVTVGQNGNVWTINATGGTATGDVVGPAGAVAGNVATFDGATGKLIQDSGLTLSGANTGDQVADGVTITGTGTIADPFVGAAGSGIGRTITSVAINTNAGAVALTDYVYICTGTIDVTLPTAVGNKNLYTIKNIGVNVVTVKPTGVETLDGETTQPIDTQYDSISFISNNSNWLIV